MTAARKPWPTASGEALGGSVEGKRIGVLGLTFKPNTDDMRDAPSIPLIEGLLAGGASVTAFDPVGREQAEPLLPGIDFANSAEEAADGADAVVIVTEWDEFRALDLQEIAGRMRGTDVGRPAKHLRPGRRGGCGPGLSRHWPRKAMMELRGVSIAWSMCRVMRNLVGN